jgi:hypothetical protein
LFDVDYYNRVKNNYLTKVYAFRKTKYYYNEIYHLIEEENYPVPSSIKIKAFIRKLFKTFGLQKLSFIGKIYTKHFLKISK